MRLSNAANGWGLSLLVPVVLVVAWWFGSLGTTSIYFPALKNIMESFDDLWLFAKWPTDVLPSLQRMAIGFGISVALGILGGLFLGASKLFRQATSPYIDFLRSVPPAAVLPLAILIFGIGDSMKIFVVVFGAVWPILLSTADGVRGVDGTLLDTVKSFGVSRTRVLFRVVLPAATPQIFAGMRTSLALAIILIVVSELTASTNGLGYFILNAQRTFAIADMWSGILLLGLIGIALNAVFMAVERVVLRWYYQAQRVEG
jgi:ABC-type nitrate/sulfonate/bicarbonate transport system permease component